MTEDEDQAQQAKGRRAVSVSSSVYGAPDGKVAFLDAPEGVIPPPFIGHLTYLGGPCDVVTMAFYQMRDQLGISRPAVQHALADRVGGVSQQDVSRWINARCAPRLNDAQWAKIIKLATGDRPA